MSKKQIHFFIEQAVFEQWDQSRIERGFSTMTGFIVGCVDDKIHPMPTNSNGIDEKLSELKQIEIQLMEDLSKMKQDNNQMVSKHSTDFTQDKKLEEKVINYLKSGTSNEYLIANDLGENPVMVYHCLAYLVELGTVEQITENKKLLWGLKE